MKRLAILLFAAGCATGAPIDGRSAYRQSGPIAIDWLRAIADLSDSDFRPLDGQGKLAPNVRGELNYFDDKFFVEEARPLLQKKLELSVHLSTDTTPDVVRVKYRVGALKLTVLETTNVSLVWVRGEKLASTPQEERSAVIAAIAAQLFNVKGTNHDWKFGPDERIGQEGNFSTDAAIDPAKMATWEQRADGGVMHGTLYFFLYKRSPSRLGYQNASNWFDPEFRKGLGGLLRFFKSEDKDVSEPQ
ncbi:MAG: hypothetical protein ABI321_16655 [Polyangia bacterium]